MNNDAWGEFIRMQGPAIQNLMSSYLEHSASAFLEMQQQLQKQTRNFAGGFQATESSGANSFASPGRDEPSSAQSVSSKDESGNKENS
jgi:hypothetical protein